ncbi:MAG TPA: rRNA maturation RNase YbeY [Candidatus Moranbacteria bacterium]|nr:rRNA maturation RNase YbeY [Candidatus Moranbacteria bacterium]HSA08472.1 rRNA maturation RNase YbeY [Candidatus Moranbacteria bacterium]
MKIDLEINNTTNSPIESGFFEMMAEKTFAELKYDFLKDKKVGISLALVSPDEIKKLNKEYRQQDSVTDILSFPEHASIEELKKAVLKNSEEELFLGELILCYNDINEYAKKEGLNLEKELAKVFSHGILHLLGFSHGDEMFALQDVVAGRVSKF